MGRRRRRAWLLLGGGAAAVVAAAAVVLAVSLSSKGGPTPGPTPQSAPIEGHALGSPQAPVTMIEFSDFQ